MFRCRQFWVNDFFFTKKVYRTLAFTDLLWITFLLSAVLRWDIIKLIFTEKVILDLDVYKGFLYITFLLSTVLRWYIIKLIFTEKVHIWLGRIKVFCVSWWKRNIIASLHFNWNKTIRKNWQTKAFQFSQRAAFHVCFILWYTRLYHATFYWRGLSWHEAVLTTVLIFSVKFIALFVKQQQQ